MLGIGLVAGTALALLAGRGAGTLLFGLKSWDPLTLAGAATLPAVVTVVASVVPSLQAANLNPIAILSVRSRRGRQKICNVVCCHR
jgi:putative ABC transport system permease protein